MTSRQMCAWLDSSTVATPKRMRWGGSAFSSRTLTHSSPLSRSLSKPTNEANMASKPKEVTILGAGVTSLTCAYELRSHGYAVHVYARDLPWDTASTSFASPWAGANWCSFATNPAERRRDEVTFHRWTQLNPHLPEETMTMMNFHQYFEQRQEVWFREVCPDFEELPTEQGYKISYTSFTISVPKYTTWLVSELTSSSPTLLRAAPACRLGPPVTFERTSTVRSLSAAASLRPCSVLINATGLGSAELSDVRDAAVHPIRGQTLLVSHPPFSGAQSIARCVMKAGAPSLYVIPRARSGHVILGGSFDVGASDLAPDEQLSERILKGCAELCPELLWKDQKGEKRDRSWRELRERVEKVNVGLRPARKGGARVERDHVEDGKGKRVDVVHAYGIAASGYQASFGIAEEVVRLVEGVCGGAARL
ncbi:hypothetical protein ACQY0O_005027 [Thecaphora frezii]